MNVNHFSSGVSSSVQSSGGTVVLTSCSAPSLLVYAASLKHCMQTAFSLTTLSARGTRFRILPKGCTDTRVKGHQHCSVFTQTETQGSKVINTVQYLHKQKHKGQRSSTLRSIYTNTRVKGHQHCSVFTQTETQGSKVINTAQYLHKQKHKGRRSSTLRSIHTQ